MAKILVTGDRGFVASYVVKQLLDSGHEIIGIDNNSKYGPTEKNYDGHSKYTSIIDDARKIELLKELVSDCDHMINFAARLGGIAYFHKFPYTILSENNALYTTAFDAAVWAYHNKKLKKITLISSSMIYESTNRWPSKENDIYKIPVPLSCYGMQKLNTHFYAEGAFMQYQLPYTILTPFNCIGLGEISAIGEEEILSGNIVLGLGHVVPDLVKKILLGQDPVHILGNGKQIRHYTPGEELAKGIITSLENPKALNEAFNISTPIGHTVKELTTIIWKKIKGNDKISFIYDKPYKDDVQKRIPDITKAKRYLDFEVKMTLNDSLDLIIPWVDNMLKLGKI